MNTQIAKTAEKDPKVKYKKSLWIVQYIVVPTFLMTNFVNVLKAITADIQNISSNEIVEYGYFVNWISPELYLALLTNTLFCCILCVMIRRQIDMYLSIKAPVYYSLRKMRLSILLPVNGMIVSIIVVNYVVALLSVLLTLSV